MRILFCDDDLGIPAQLRDCLREYFEAKSLPQPEYASYSDGAALLADCERSPHPDIAFLDVEMPGVSGIQVGAKLQEKYPYMKIFILTSYADYLDDAMRFHVFRYLSKPLDKARLFRNMDDALYQLSIDTRPVLIETAGESVTRHAHEIVMVETEGRRVLVHTTVGCYESAKPMKHWECLLEIGSFYRTHRGFIVNMRYVRSFSSNLITLETPDGSQCSAYMSRRRYQDFKNAYLLYVEASK